nr:TetR family transcriptional regulator [Paenibacillus sp. CAA11]
MASDDKQRKGLRERKKAKAMAEVQKHALRLFREQGYKATTVEQIAEAAEISYSTFFRYFTSKEDVLMVDNYDPVLIAAFEEQPPSLHPVQALKNAMVAGLAEMSDEELVTMRERNELIMSVPELRASSMNNMTQMIQLLSEMISKRTGRDASDITVRSLAGAVMGINISVMEYYAQHPEADFAALLNESLSQLDQGFDL